MFDVAYRPSGMRNGSSGSTRAGRSSRRVDAAKHADDGPLGLVVGRLRGEGFMRIEGTIRPTGDASDFNREAWCQLVGRNPEFRRPQLRKITNPFSAEAAMIQPSGDVAEVLVEGRSVGEVCWSMSDEALVNVSVEPSALPLVEQWAAALGGEFHAEADVQARGRGFSGGIAPL